jgi:stringent starvation protein B
MLEACRVASAVECLIVAPSVPGVVLPVHLHEEALVRLDLVAGRDTPALELDDWGVRATLTFRGQRFECAIPWTAVLAGILTPPPKERPRFGVIAGGKKD